MRPAKSGARESASSKAAKGPAATALDPRRRAGGATSRCRTLKVCGDANLWRRAGGATSRCGEIWSNTVKFVDGVLNLVDVGQRLSNSS